MIPIQNKPEKADEMADLILMAISWWRKTGNQ